MRQIRWIVSGAFVFGIGGCVAVNRPLLEVHRDPPPVDSRRVPPTASHEDCREELRRAYAHIDELEQKNRELAGERDRYRHERDAYKDRLKKVEKG